MSLKKGWDEMLKIAGQSEKDPPKIDWDIVLLRAAMVGDVASAERALLAGANIHTWQDQSLRDASREGYLEMVKFLVTKGADIHAQEDCALRWAARYGHLAVVKFLVAKGADIHVQEDCALRWAAQYGHLAVVEFLVAKGADIHAQTDYALRKCILETRNSNDPRYGAVIDFLLEHGRWESVDEKGLTPLKRLAENKDFVFAELAFEKVRDYVAAQKELELKRRAEAVRAMQAGFKKIILKKRRK